MIQYRNEIVYLLSDIISAPAYRWPIDIEKKSRKKWSGWLILFIIGRQTSKQTTAKIPSKATTTKKKGGERKILFCTKYNMLRRRLLGCLFAHTFYIQESGLVYGTEIKELLSCFLFLCTISDPNQRTLILNGSFFSRRN